VKNRRDRRERKRLKKTWLVRAEGPTFWILMVEAWLVYPILFADIERVHTYTAFLVSRTERRHETCIA
jgi:hypothetical protein